MHPFAQRFDPFSPFHQRVPDRLDCVCSGSDGGSRVAAGGFRGGIDQA